MSMPEPSPVSRGSRVSPPHPRRVTPSWQRHLHRADRQAENGEWEEAIASLERAIRAGANAYDCTLRIAEHYRNQQRWPLALAAAERAVALEPNLLPGYEAIAAIALETGEYARAIQACYAMIKRAPRHIPAYSALGAAYIQMGDVDAAMRVINTLIRIDPNTAAHHFKKALLCQHKNEVALAVHEFTRTIRLEPEGAYADAARESLETLDSYQLNHILLLAMEDRVFRTKLERDPVSASEERGFALSEVGKQMLSDLCGQPLTELVGDTRPLRYN